MSLDALVGQDAKFIPTYRIITSNESELALRRKKRLVAFSECTITCATDEVLRACVEQIRLSDEHLRNRPEEKMLWEWEHTKVAFERGVDQAGGTVHLGVAWYDLDFFEAKKDVYTQEQHLAQFLRIGLESGTVAVSHWKLAGGGNV